MAEVAAEQELYRACRIIFGSELTVSREFLEYIQPAGVKSAFRRKAMETHPDRMADHDEVARKKSARMFHAVQQAYEKLLHYVDAREKGFRFHGAGHQGRGAAGNGGGDPAPPGKRWPGQKTAAHAGFGGTAGTTRNGRSAGEKCQNDGGRKAAAAQPLYQGNIPERPLLFGHYLYYAGQVSWQSIVEALMWQRSQRPRLGEIAKERGWLNSEKVSLVLKGCLRSSLPFGQQAVQQGLLTPAQLQTLVVEQKRQHKKFGQFFLDQKILTPQQLQVLLFRFQRHNARLARTGSAWTR
jgi:hypothetical protein